MGKRKAVVVDIDGVIRENPDFPVAVLREQPEDKIGSGEGDWVDPVFTSQVTRNLFGRIMTLLEATTEPSRLKAVKDVFSKELRSWEDEVYSSATDIASRGSSIGSRNTIYK